MKVYLLLLLISTSSFATSVSPEQLLNVVDYMRDASAEVHGDLTPDQTIKLFDQNGIGATLNRGFPLSFSLTESGLAISGLAGEPGPLTLNIGPIPLKIEGITYNKDGSFHVKMKTPANILEKELEAKMNEELDRAFKNKMKTAFEKLSTLRQQRSLGDAKLVVDSIIEILAEKTGASKKGPDLNAINVAGNVNVSISPQHSRSLEVGDITMMITKADKISVGVEFEKHGHNISIEKMEMTSTHGVVFKPKSETKDNLISAKVFGITIDANGMTPTYITGPEEALGGFQLVMKTLLAYQGGAGLAVDPHCISGDFRIGPVQDWLNCILNGQLAVIVNQNRSTLLRAGINQKVVAALLVPPKSRVNCSQFVHR
jgi:hypothetical protein